MRTNIVQLLNLIVMASYFTRSAFSAKFVPQERETYLNMSVKEKRKLYKCKDNYVTINDIPTWPEYFNENLKRKTLNYDVKQTVNETLNSKISIFIGDITCLEIDSIVNAANERLLGGGGVDGAIHRAASNLLLEECRTLNGCRTGQAKITAGYKLPAKYVIHTVGPRGYFPEDLKNAYLNSLNAAIENNCRTIAFPCISTGVFGYPNDKASSEVSSFVRKFLESNSDKFDRIIFCLFMDKDIKLYEKFLRVHFPISENAKKSTADCRKVEHFVEAPFAKEIKKPIAVLKTNDKQ